MDWRSSLFATTVARSFSHSVMRSANALFGMFVSFLPFSPQPLREVDHGVGDSEVAAGMAAGQCDGDVLQGLHDPRRAGRSPAQTPRRSPRTWTPPRPWGTGGRDRSP